MSEWFSRENDRIPSNPPELTRLVSVKVLKPFCVAGRPLPVGDVYRLEYHLARDLARIGKCELLER
jgi:hypothetical protein